MKRALPPSEVNAALHQALAGSVQNLPNYVKDPDKNFTRERKLGITKMTSIILTMGSKALQDEIIDRKTKVLQKLATPVVKKYTPLKHYMLEATPGAFSARRQLLSPRFFQDALNEFNRLTMKRAYTIKGLRMIIVDGSDIRLDANPKEVDYYIKKADGSKPYNQIHLDAFFDPLEGVFLAASTRGKKKTDERRVAIELLWQCPDKDIILTGDRGYESYNLLAHVQEHGSFFLIRVKDVDSNGILSGLPLPEEEEFDVFFDMTLTSKNTADVKQLVFDHPESYKYIPGKNFDFLPDKCLKNDPMSTYRLPFRVVRIHLEGNKYETLITNLDSKEFPPEMLKELYHLRWGIEVAYRNFKYATGVLAVHSKKVACVEQELYSHLLLYNYTQLMINYVDENRVASPYTRYRYKPAFSAGVGHVRRYFNGDITLDQMLRYMERSLVAIKPGRKAERAMKAKKALSFTYRGGGG